MRQKPWVKVVGSVSLAIAVTVALVALMGARGIDDDSRLGHFGFHAAYAASFGILFYSSRRVWPSPRDGVERGFRKTLVLGFALAFIGSILESLGAFGYADNDGYIITNDVLADVHGIALVFTIPGFLAILLGLVATVMARILYRIRKKSVVT